MFILRADGTVNSAVDKRGFFGRGGLESQVLQPGDALVVPNQLDFETWGRALVRNLKDFAQIFSGFGIGIAAINSICNNLTRMLSADSTTPLAAAQALYDSDEDDEPSVSLTEVLTWLGEKKALIGAVTVGVAAPLARRRAAAATDLHGANDLPRPGLAAAERLGGGARRARLARRPGRRLGAKTPDDLYVALLKSDSVASRARQALRPQDALRRRQLRGAAQGAADLRSRQLRQEERRDQRRGRRQGRRSSPPTSPTRTRSRSRSCSAAWRSRKRSCAAPSSRSSCRTPRRTWSRPSRRCGRCRRSRASSSSTSRPRR